MGDLEVYFGTSKFFGKVRNFFGLVVDLEWWDTARDGPGFEIFRAESDFFENFDFPTFPRERFERCEADPSLVFDNL